MQDIAAALPRHEPASGLFGGGLCDHLLFHACYSSCFDDDGAARLAERTLSGVLERLDSRVPSVALFGGLAGAGWVFAHVLEADEEDAWGSRIDFVLADFLNRRPSPLQYDLVSGLVGMGVYALERRPHGSSEAMLATLLSELEQLGERTREGTKWHTAPVWLPEHERRVAPGGYENLGLAHGIPGIIGLLARMVVAGVAVERSRVLLEQAVEWLLAQKRPDWAGNCFAAWMAVDVEQEARLAWCYGDPGVALALYSAAGALRRRDWRDEAIAIIMRAAARPEQTAGVVDAGLCHGAVGLAHVFNRFFQATGARALRDAAQRWLHVGVNMRREGRGIAGFETYSPAPSDEGAMPHPTAGRDASSWRPDSSLLSGAVGIGLSLMAAISDDVPTWDRVMLMDVPADF